MSENNPSSTSKALVPLAFLVAALVAGWLWASSSTPTPQNMMAQPSTSTLNTLAPAAGGVSGEAEEGMVVNPVPGSEQPEAVEAPAAAAEGAPDATPAPKADSDSVEVPVDSVTIEEAVGGADEADVSLPADEGNAIESEDAMSGESPEEGEGAPTDAQEAETPRTVE